MVELANFTINLDILPLKNISKKCIKYDSIFYYVKSTIDAKFSLVNYNAVLTTEENPTKV